VKSISCTSLIRLVQCAWLMVLASFAISAQPSAETLKRVKQAVVSITTYDVANKPLLTGTGFFVSGRLITNFHVVKGAQGISIRTYDGRIYSATKISAANEKNDLVVLQVSDLVTNVTSLSAAFHSKAEGEMITVVGVSDQRSWKLATGVTTGTWFLNGAAYIGLTAQIRRGNSGSPVINDLGEVVAIATLHVASADDFNFAVPAQVMAALLPCATDPCTLSTSLLPANVR